MEEQKVDYWGRVRKHHKVIHHADWGPPHRALERCRKTMRGRSATLFVDSDAARCAIVEGASRNKTSAEIVHTLWVVAAENSIFLWAETVPSRSDISDGPSRGDWMTLESGFRRRHAGGLAEH